jgi:predicted nucleic acid-binding protein
VSSSAAHVIVIIDANILINLMHAGRLELLGELPRFAFVVPTEVVAEITAPDQKAQLAAALNRGALREVSLTEIGELTTYAECRRIMGKGEAACLALAQERRWLIASDERRKFRREAIARLGEGRLMNTAGLFVLAIRAGLLSIEEADQAKAELEHHRFRMAFRSFRDLIEEG